MNDETATRLANNLLTQIRAANAVLPTDLQARLRNAGRAARKLFIDGGAKIFYSGDEKTGAVIASALIATGKFGIRQFPNESDGYDVIAVPSGVTTNAIIVTTVQGGRVTHTILPAGTEWTAIDKFVAQYIDTTLSIASVKGAK